MPVERVRLMENHIDVFVSRHVPVEVRSAWAIRIDELVIAVTREAESSLLASRASMRNR